MNTKNAELYKNDILYLVLDNGYLWPIANVGPDGQMVRFETGPYDPRRMAYEEAFAMVAARQRPDFSDDSFFFKILTPYTVDLEVLVRDAATLSEVGRGEIVALLTHDETPVEVEMVQPLSSVLWPALPSYEESGKDGTRGWRALFDPLDPEDWERGTLADGQRGWSGN